MDKTPQTELVEFIHKTLLPVLPELAVGPLGSGRGAALQLTGGGREEAFLDRRQTRYLTLLLLCKEKSQERAFDSVCRAANFLRGLHPLPQPKKSEWVRCEIETEPQGAGMTNGMYLYTCVIHAYYHF